MIAICLTVKKMLNFRSCFNMDPGNGPTSEELAKIKSGEVDGLARDWKARWFPSEIEVFRIRFDPNHFSQR